MKTIEELKNNMTLNDTKANVLENSSLIDLFTAQVEKTPTHIAIKADEVTYTYAALDELSNKLAQYLIREHKIAPNTIVAIKLDRNEWLLIAMLAVLKAGATYLPIEIKSAPEREQFILEDAKVAVLLCSSELLSETNFTGKICTVDSDFDATKYTNETINKIDSNEQNAYIIYTSGSTGTPKGAIISHKSLINYLLWGKDYYLNGLEEVSFGLFTSIAFDLTVTSQFLPLISGGTLTMYPSSYDIISTLKAYINTKQTCIKLTPAHIAVLDTLNLKSTQLKVAIVGGDVLHQSHVDILLNINPNMKIYNEYGPTEATVGCVVYEVVSGQDIIIGKPIQNTQVYVLDENYLIVPKGVTGELCISGIGLAKGYFNNPELTKQKFIDNPFIKNQKLYKTGDLVKWVDKENLHFIGRTDDQVKIRGYRIELGEVEQQIIQKEHVKEVAVLVHEAEDGEKQLIAYITSAIGEDITDIRNFLLEKVPDYMVPSVFIQIENFPLTINGKIDKKKLIKTEGKTLSNTIAYVAPRNEIEEKLAVLWQEVLKQETIGIHDDFLSLGGQSIVAIKLITRIHREFEILLELKDVFRERTIEKLSDYMETIIMLEKQQNTNENETGQKLIF
ncbi:Tyrocidine synthase 3 [Kordia antarctica]|uniref:Tyrocidine synthase 3 n=1 Tax=Kordia antarctica TaxID=1218801 RepID=A0A7L4ZFY4_9FLAO|nr:non-ribosomal peptide synthetase [Kordia antarctica]QHI35400.1 Tyrocidine synthase 3 [Kordia antarctica]